MAKKTFGIAQWTGGLKDGKGIVSTQSGELKDQPYGFDTRFEDTPGTNPEELIGAAHASCYAMAMSLFLAEAGFTAEQMDTRSDVSLEQDGGGFSVKRIQLSIKAKIPGIGEAKFHEIATAAKENCPISKLLTAQISLDAQLLS